jgi:hypothetical protein
VIGVRPFQVNGSPIGDRQKFFDPAPSLVFDPRILLTQRIGHNTAYALPCYMDDCLREAMRFGPVQRSAKLGRAKTAAGATSELCAG